MVIDPFEQAILKEEAEAEARGGGGDGDGEEEDVEALVDDAPPPSFNEDNAAKISALLQTFTEEQMKRYEAFRRSGFTKSKLKKVVAKIVENQKVSEEINIVVSALAKMFVGDLVETARVVMTEWQHTGPIRPCHIKEAYRRLKLEGKTFKRTVPPLFR